MSIETENLDTFSAEFFGTSAPEPVIEDTSETTPVQEDPVDEDVSALEPDDDTVATEQDDEGEEAASAAEEPKKKTRYQERIDQFSEKVRLATELAASETARREALEARLAKLEAETPQPKQEVQPKGEPTPNDLNDDGTDKYPLGEFDPNFARDLIKFTLEGDREAMRKEAEAQAEQAKIDAAEAARATEWNSRLAPAKERYPDFDERGQELLGTFAGIDEQYGNFLTDAIMSMDHGPDVLYYLSTNISEAERIVNLGALGATLALGRIEAKFEADATGGTQSQRVSQAPPPPPANKGSAVALAEIADDTDDLDAFTSKMFKKK